MTVSYPMAVKIAISGAGGVGQAISDALNSQLLDHIILTRALSPSLDEHSKARYVVVDYGDVEGLAKLLEQHEIHTIISTLSLVREEAGKSQLSLIRAAEKSAVTKRFIPSEFSIPTDDMVADFIPYHRHKREAAQLLSQTSLEWTLIHSGLFLDYWGMPYYPSHLERRYFLVDMEHNFAVIPGTGSVPVVFTHTSDIGRYIIAILQLPVGSWDREYVLIGERLSINEFVKIAEEVRGKFRVVRDDIEKLKSGNTTDLPVQELMAGSNEEVTMRRAFSGKLGLLIEAGKFDLDEKPDIAGGFGIIAKKARDILGAWQKN